MPELWNRKSNDGREAVAVGEMTVVMVYPKAPENESYSRWRLPEMNDDGGYESS